MSEIFKMNFQRQHKNNVKIDCFLYDHDVYHMCDHMKNRLSKNNLLISRL